MALNDVYKEKDSKEWIIPNGLYFSLNTGNEEMSQNEISKYLLWIIRLS